MSRIEQLSLCIDKIEDWIQEHYFVAFMSVFFGGGLISALLCKYYGRNVVTVAVCLLWYYCIIFVGLFKYIYGWRKSVKRFLLLGLLFNAIPAFLLATEIRNIIQIEDKSVVFLVIYGLLWGFLSVIAESRVAIFVNEIISCVSASVFTIGTYLTSEFLSVNEIYSEMDMYGNMSKEEIEKAFPEVIDTIAGYFSISLVRMVDKLLLLLIGVSALGLALAKVKAYVIENQKEEERLF